MEGPKTAIGLSEHLRNASYMKSQNVPTTLSENSSSEHLNKDSEASTGPSTNKIIFIKPKNILKVSGPSSEHLSVDKSKPIQIISQNVPTTLPEKTNSEHLNKDSEASNGNLNSKSDQSASSSKKIVTQSDLVSSDVDSKSDKVTSKNIIFVKPKNILKISPPPISEDVSISKMQPKVKKTKKIVTKIPDNSSIEKTVDYSTDESIDQQYIKNLDKISEMDSPYTTLRADTDYKCLCGFKTWNRKELAAHRKIHKCKKCEVIFEGSHSLRDYLRHVKYCDADFYELLVKEHPEIKKKPIKKAKCKFCTKKFANLYQLKTHVESIHNMKATWKAVVNTGEEEQQKGVASPDYMVISPATPPITTKSKGYNCEICDKKFFRYVALKRHTEIVHNIIMVHGSEQQHELIKTEDIEELNYNCEYCHNKFPSPKSLKVHIFKIHKKATEIAKFIPKITKSSIVIDDKYCFESIESTIGNSSSFKYIPPVQSTGLVNTNCINLIKK